MGNSEHKFVDMSMKRIWSEGRLVLYPTSTANPLSISNRVWNNGCLLKTVNYGGERGASEPPRYQATHQKKTEPSKVKVR